LGIGTFLLLSVFHTLRTVNNHFEKNQTIRLCLSAACGLLFALSYLTLIPALLPGN
jgi:hypothetical protein